MSPPLRILSLDQAPSHIGWAYGDDRVSTLPKTGTRSGIEFTEAYRPSKAQLRKWLDPLLDEALPKYVTVEQILNTPDWRTLYKQFSLVAAIEDICEARGIDVFDIEIKDWRQRARIPTRRPEWAKAEKDWLKHMAETRCFERGWKFNSHHAAEAALMLDWSLANWSPEYRHRTAALLRRIDTEFDNKTRAFKK